MRIRVVVGSRKVWMLFQTGCGVPVAAVDVRCYAADESETEYPFYKYERIMGNEIGIQCLSLFHWQYLGCGKSIRIYFGALPYPQMQGTLYNQSRYAIPGICHCLHHATSNSVHRSFHVTLDLVPVGSALRKLIHLLDTPDPLEPVGVGDDRR